MEISGTQKKEKNPKNQNPKHHTQTYKQQYGPL